MIITDPSYEIVDHVNGQEILERIERAGRTCYKSEDRITEASAAKFVKMVIARGHESVIEHEKISVRIICDRGVSHEIVRHRLASYSQESTRYCNYGKKDEGVTFIRPCFWWIKNKNNYVRWKGAMENAEDSYLRLLKFGATPQEARSVLPNSLKTEIVVTANLREWRHIFRLRCAAAAHPQMRQIMIPLLKEMRSKIPVVFEDIRHAEG